MNRDETKNIIKANLQNYLEMKGINTRRPFSCLNPDHPDSTPSMMYSRQHNICHCFGCGVNADIFNILSWDYDTTDFKELMKIGSDIFNLSQDNMPAPKIKPISKPQKPTANRAPKEVCDKVYRALKSVSPLTKKDVEYLSNSRGLTIDRIEKDYFRLKETDRKQIVAQIKRITGYSDDTLKKVPGFFIHRKTKVLDYCYHSGIGILIHDTDGLAVAVQIRKDKGNLRYCWFASRFALEDQIHYDGGATPGCPHDVLIPQKTKHCLCITEGRFKSEILAQNHNVTISIQGVTAWRGIDETIQSIMEKKKINSIYLVFDSDIMGNTQILSSLPKLVKMLREKFPKCRIMTATWKKEFGKGIDDCILNGNIDKVKYVDAERFFHICTKSANEIKKNFNRKDENARKQLSENLQRMNERLLA